MAKLVRNDCPKSVESAELGIPLNRAIGRPVLGVDQSRSSLLTQIHFLHRCAGNQRFYWDQFKVHTQLWRARNGLRNGFYSRDSLKGEWR